MTTLYSQDEGYQRFYDEPELDDGSHDREVTVEQVFGEEGLTEDGDGLDGSGVETLTLIRSSWGQMYVRGEYNDYGGGDSPHYYVSL